MTDHATTLNPFDALAAIDWQIELGADEAIDDAPINRYEVKPAPKAKTQPVISEPVAPLTDHNPTEEIAAACANLDALRDAIQAFDGCELKQGARNMVFADGVRGAKIMIVGEAPGREEDMQGLPFVGPSGQLLDKMFAAIGLSRKAETPSQGIYITNTLPWRPPQNRDPSSDELAMMLPFLRRHIELAAPKILITMGNPSTKTLLQTTKGITGLRGKWASVKGIATLPMFHTAALLRDPLKKRDAWSDLLQLKKRLEQ